MILPNPRRLAASDFNVLDFQNYELKDRRLQRNTLCFPYIDAAFPVHFTDWEAIQEWIDLHAPDQIIYIGAFGDGIHLTAHDPAPMILLRMCFDGECPSLP